MDFHLLLDTVLSEPDSLAHLEHLLVSMKVNSVGALISNYLISRRYGYLRQEIATISCIFCPYVRSTASLSV